MKKEADPAQYINRARTIPTAEYEGSYLPTEDITMSVHWNNGLYKSAEELSRAVEKAGGLTKFLLNIPTANVLPYELQLAARSFRNSHALCKDLFEDAGVRG